MVNNTHKFTYLNIIIIVMWKKTKLLQWYCKEPFEPFLNSTYEQYIDRPINHGHWVYCCINYVLVFALFTIIIYWTETGQGVHENSTYHTNRPFDCAVVPSDIFKNEGLCWKLLLGQAWFEFHCTSYSSCCTHSMGTQIRYASPP